MDVSVTQGIKIIMILSITIMLFSIFSFDAESKEVKTYNFNLELTKTIGDYICVTLTSTVFLYMTYQYYRWTKR